MTDAPDLPYSATVAAQHAATAAVLTEVVEQVRDWDAPTPVAEWTARDVVGHLTTWLPGLLGGSGVRLVPGPSAAVDPVASWRHQCAEVQRLLENPDLAELPVTFPGGERSTAQVIAEFYEPDVFLHAWDLARSQDLPFALDEERATATLAGMESIEPMLRDSGQFGERQPVGPGATAEERLIAFIGRDPHWRAPAAS